MDAVVVGSGFGGSVTAYRLAEAGLSVVLLERGRPYPPGSFARTPAELGRAFWDPAAGLYGLFDVRSFRRFDSVVASGLGGGSLVYANVLLRKDEHWFVDEQPLPSGGYESWPVSRADLDPHYDAVERMLGATPYPLDRPPYTRTPKTHAMREAAGMLGLDFQLPPLAVSFAPEPGADPEPGLPISGPAYGNLHGTGRRTCRLCGECNLGCNDGAKNSLDHTYLSAARHHGADLRAHHEVRAIRPLSGGGYAVDYLRHAPNHADRRDGHRGPPATRTIGCDRLVLAAGTYGTSALLLRSRRFLPGLSPALGTRFSTNGDLLAILVRAGRDGRPRPLEPSRGPVITAAIRLPDALDTALDTPGETGRGGYLEDGGYPGFVDWLAEGAHLPQQLSRGMRFALGRILANAARAPETHLSRAVSELVGQGLLSSTSFPLLGMGRDTPNGVLRLRDGRLDADWSPAASAAYFDRLRDTMRQVADVLEARHIDNPLWYRKRVVSVHPVGGAPMAHHAADGVCDPYGEVHGHPGLYVADGAALPGPVGTNPSLTIAALADRMCTHLLEHRSATPAGRSAHLPPTATTYRESTSLTFTERMRGSYQPGARHPGAASATEEYASPAQRISARLTVTIVDVDDFLDEPGHRAGIDGWIDAPSLGGRRPILRGTRHMFSPNDGPEGRALTYRLHFTDAENRPRALTGRKELTGETPLSLWPETTVLPFRLFDGHVRGPGEQSATVVGAGRLSIPLTEFLRQLTTFRTTGPRDAAALDRFGRFILGRLWHLYAPRTPWRGRKRT
ncbi:GMC family oxidoreductase [Streptomyces sp. 8K308]|uniref:FAD-dependent oxidoreductase n=1 Tax=Streptomyces sp. 8K308 TaxID=2530388 RepID=UPI001A9D1C46|nr:GMC family oxidoreductase [Streptomyces sp. 8K308]